MPAPGDSGRLRAVAAIEDPADRAIAAHQLMLQWQLLMEQASAMRRKAMDELLGRGLTGQQVGDLLGISAARVGQLRTARRELAERYLRGREGKQ